MRLRLSLCAGFLLCGHALAQDVYPGCEVPTTVAGRHTFFVDPVKGSDKGDGSMGRPWKSLNTVFAGTSKLIATKSHKTVTGSPLLAVNPTAPIKGGDIIMLMSGDYGDVVLINAFNDKFITVMPAPGQKPIIQHLKIGGVARWLFQGLTFQSEYPSGSKANAMTQVTVSDGWSETTKNVIFDSDTFRTTDNASGWSDADWYSKPNFYSLGIKATCVTVTNSNFKNVWNGIQAFGPQSLIKNNTIDSFSNDAIDVDASNVSVVSNTIQNSSNNHVNTLHPDAIQVWSDLVNGKIATNTNITIDSNKIYTPKGDNGNYLQGITVGMCDNVIVQNNVVVTNHWIGIYLNGTHDSRIVNNTVMPSDPVGHPTWIHVSPSVYSASTNIVIRNNVATNIRAEDKSITFDHNAASWGFSTFVNGKAVTHKQSDTTAQNLVLPTLDSDFRNWNPTKQDFDLHLKAASALDAKGAGTLTPSLDVDGRNRMKPVDLGAYSR